jgi:hypothetical protein
VSQFQYPGLARPLALYCVDGLVFYAATGAMQAISDDALSLAVLTRRRSGDHSEASAMTAQLDLLEFPEHPHKSGAETDDDSQEHQSKSGSCEHGEHPSKEANGVNSERAEIIATEIHYTKVATASRAMRFLFF